MDVVGSSEYKFAVVDSARGALCAGSIGETLALDALSIEEAGAQISGEAISQESVLEDRSG